MPSPAPRPSPPGGLQGREHGSPKSRSQASGGPPGLGSWLGFLGIEGYRSQIVAWAEQMGAVTLEEIADNGSLLAATLPLKPLEARRLERDGHAAAQRVSAATSSEGLQGSSAVGKAAACTPSERGGPAAAASEHLQGSAGLTRAATCTASEEAGGQAPVVERRITSKALRQVPSRAAAPVQRHKIVDDAWTHAWTEAPEVLQADWSGQAQHVQEAEWSWSGPAELADETDWSGYAATHIQADSSFPPVPRNQPHPSASASSQEQWGGSSPSAATKQHAHEQWVSSCSSAATRPQAPGFLRVRLVVDPTCGAGLSLLWCSCEGYRVQEIEDWPGQPGLKVGDVICRAGSISLWDAGSVEEAERRFASAFVDSAVLEVERSCFNVSLRVQPTLGAGLSLVWVPQEGYMVEEIEESPGQIGLRSGDVLRTVGSSTLSGHRDEASADRTLAQVLKDGVSASVFRPCCDSSLGDLLAVRCSQGGSSKLFWPSVAIGTWSWGNQQFGPGRVGARSEHVCGAAAKDVIRGAFEAAVDHGSFLFDVAPTYGQGFAEESLGHFCNTNMGRYAVAATKHFPRPGRQDLAAAVIATAREAAARLQLDGPLELLQLHKPAEPPCSLEAQADALAAAVKIGVTKAVGVCNFSLAELQVVHERLMSAHGLPLSSCQVELSLARQLPVASGLVTGCRELGITVLAYSPLAMGRLSGKYDPSRGQQPPWQGRDGEKSRPFGGALDGDPTALSELLQKLREMGRRYGGKSPSQVALNWVLCQGAVAIAGARNRAQAEENAGAMGWRLSPEDASYLGALGARGKTSDFQHG
eukprot:TRINITY_DN16438_c0_g1_i1.p1 TRINITY_DN16438_c0_g1~~TRINITY_DN16438_c0_g1_i1.p1  ORF type:complete len:840 (-),score=159.34 TRINITY_DN16438_c0_g1_i1:19-2460(-)